MYLFKYHFVCVFVSCTLDVHALTSLSFLDHVSDVLFCMFAHTYTYILTKHAKKKCNDCPLIVYVSLSDTRELSQCLVWSSFFFPPVPINKGLGLTFTSAHILVRALVDGPGSQPTDTMDHIKCVVRAPVAMVAVSLPHVCHRRETGLSP